MIVRLNLAARNPPPTVRRLEAKDYFRAAGIEIPPGGDAVFDPGSSRLVVRATPEVLRQVEELVQEGVVGQPRQVQVVLGLAEFTVPDAQALADLNYERARALAGDSWRMLERTSLVAKSGQKSTGVYPIAPLAGEAAPAKPKASATPEWMSEEFEIEPQIGPDETEVSLEFRVVRHQPAGPSPKHFDAMEKLALRSDTPTLVRATALPASKGAKVLTVRALIVRARVVDQTGAPPAPKPERPPPEQR